MDGPYINLEFCLAECGIGKRNVLSTPECPLAKTMGHRISLSKRAEIQMDLCRGGETAVFFCFCCLGSARQGEETDLLSAFRAEA